MRGLADGLLAYRTNELVDADGRALGEVSSPRYDAVRTEVVACPYADGRRGRPMNLSALRQLGSPWASILATVRSLAGEAPTVHRVWWVALAGVAAPLRVEEPVPVPISALYKAALGLSQVTAALLLADDGVADVPFASLGDDRSFFALLDEGGWLHGQLQVCAGSEPQIRELATALAGSPPHSGAIGAPFGETGFVDLATTVVGLQAAYLASVYGAVRDGQGTGLPGTPAEAWLRRAPPWQRAVLAVPNRPPAHVRRLYPEGRTPAVVERFLDDGPATAGALAERFAVAVASLG